LTGEKISLNNINLFFILKEFPIVNAFLKKSSKLFTLNVVEDLVRNISEQMTVDVVICEILNMRKV
jgi:hypothetical protein